MTFAMQGNAEKAWELLAILGPINHGSQPEEIERYKVEPYVMAADIYGVASHTMHGEFVNQAEIGD
jgi:cellobiose phosphorylase